MSEQSSILDSAIGHDAMVTLPIRTKGVRFTVRCRVFGWKRSYGRVVFNVSPINGAGGAWIKSTSVEILPKSS